MALMQETFLCRIVAKFLLWQVFEPLLYRNDLISCASSKRIPFGIKRRMMRFMFSIIPFSLGQCGCA